jgi:hypothetical protein
VQFAIPLRSPRKQTLEKLSSRFSSARCRIEIPKEVYLPGEKVPVRAQFEFARRARVEKDLIALRCVWSYEVETENGSYIKDESRNWLEETLWVERDFEAGELLTDEFTARIPNDAPPSAKGSTLQVRWDIYVQLGMSGVDLRQSRPLVVLSSPKQGGGGPFRASGECPEYEIQLEADSNFARPGESFTGRVTAAARSDLKAKRIQVRLKTKERIYSTTSSMSGKTVVETILDTDPELAAGVTRTYPFACPVPENACPSLETRDIAVTWTLEAKVERRLRADADAELPVEVTTAPKGPP